ncbi:unnamed protein product [Bursaphelenchus okinawaensis]|uniref:G-patch domain-containing protein n=1 Tax=Bursaphelenchus okinawaensis TaxID=465554 RepID=A0A811LPT7_9BILA|nr:unnamed protein product [Bursaphelenchus okinawaensis]CAG9125762.1 unnamed protein product [Bursaphelenchus okinawaensis]
MPNLQAGFQRINFVKAGTEVLESLSEKKNIDLDGNEVRSFYESVTSCSTTKVPHQKAVKSTHNVGIKQTVISKSADNNGLSVSDRDVRLFLKAVNDNDLIKAQEYLDKGVDVNSKDSFNWTALMIAAAEGHKEMVKMLIENGADDEYSNGKFDAVKLAREKGHRKLANWIIGFRDHLDEPCSSTSNRELYCELCGLTYTDSNHANSIVHIVNLEQKPDRVFAYDIPMSNIGFRILKRKGWTEESGLGKDGEGRQYPIRTMLKRDRKGLGVERLPMKVTHFGKHDLASVKTVEKKKMGHAKEMRKKMEEKKKREEAIRRMLNSD